MRKFRFVILLIISGFSLTITAQVRFELNINQPPELTIGILDTIFANSGDTVHLGRTDLASGGSPPYIFVWEPDSGLSANNIPDPVVYPQHSGSYKLVISDHNGCTVSTEQAVILANTTEYKIPSPENYITVYPNPNHGTFFYKIRLPGIKKIKITVFDITGHKIIEKSISLPAEMTYTGTINLNTHPKGYYILKIHSKEISFYKKLIVL